MKNRLTCLLACFLVIISISSCSTADYIEQYPSVKDMLIRSSWSIEMTVNNQPPAHDYSDYRLLFDDGGIAMCAKANSNCLGNWESNNERLTVQFNSTDAQVQDLNRTWKVSSKNSTHIKFVSENPQAPGELTLSRN